MGHIARSWSGISTPKYMYQTKQKQATMQQKAETPQTKEICTMQKILPDKLNKVKTNKQKKTT